MSVKLQLVKDSKDEPSYLVACRVCDVMRADCNPDCFRKRAHEEKMRVEREKRLVEVELEETKSNADQAFYFMMAASKVLRKK